MQLHAPDKRRGKWFMFLMPVKKTKANYSGLCGGDIQKGRTRTLFCPFGMKGLGLKREGN
jgi:hypothetical protein